MHSLYTIYTLYIKAGPQHEQQPCLCVHNVSGEIFTQTGVPASPLEVMHCNPIFCIP